MNRCGDRFFDDFDLYLSPAYRYYNNLSQRTENLYRSSPVSGGFTGNHARVKQIRLNFLMRKEIVVDIFEVEVKRAVPRGEQNQNQHEQFRGQNRNFRNNGTKTNNNLKTKKIFVGGLSANLTEDDFKFYFEKFGRITDVVVMHDNVTHRPRGFGFITFDSEDSVEEVMQKSFHELGGKLVEVKRAVPKEVSGGITSSNRDSNFSGGHQQAAPYRPIYDVLPGYGLFPSYGGYPYGGGVFGGGYPVGGYGLAAVPPRMPWGGPAMLGIRGGPLPLTVYPAYLNDGHGLMGMAANGYNGIVGPTASGMPSQLSEQQRGSVDNNSLRSTGGEARKYDQSGVEGNNE